MGKHQTAGKDKQSGKGRKIWKTGAIKIKVILSIKTKTDISGPMEAIK